MCSDFAFLFFVISTDWQGAQNVADWVFLCGAGYVSIGH
jgi:hypothetical protein